MASVIEIPCPNCKKPLKVPESVFGKKIKCKICNHPFVARNPDETEEDEEKPVKRKPPGKLIDDQNLDELESDAKPAQSKPAVKPSKPGGASVKAKTKEEPKKEEPKKEEPKPESTYKFEDDDEEGAKPKPLGVVDEGIDVPRCPHCAAELDPPDAVVCVNCGFNNVTRVKAETKKVWEPDANDWINHLGPGVLALLAWIGILITDIVCIVNMRDWMTDTFLMKDDPGPDGEKAFWVKPGAFIAFIIAVDILPFIACVKFSIKRLIIDNQPTEKIKT